MLLCSFFFFLMIRRPPRSTLFPTRRSSDLELARGVEIILDPDDGLVGRRHAHVEHRVHLDRDVVARDDILRRDIDRHHSDRKSTRLNSSHGYISYAVFCLKKKKKTP